MMSFIRSQARIFFWLLYAGLGHLSPDAAVAVGDTPYDVQAAKKIGLPIIAVLCGGFPEDNLRAEGAAAIFRDPAHLLEGYYRSPLAN